MHIPDAVLPLPWALAWAVPAIFYIRKCLKVFKKKVSIVPIYKPLLGMLGAAVTLVSILHIPIPFAGSSAHAVATPLAAILVGPYLAGLLGFIALIFQAVFFAHGGIFALGFS